MAGGARRRRAAIRGGAPLIRGFGDVGHSVRTHADVAIVGSGAGGAVLAKELAERGRSVVVLEEGGHYTARDFTSRTYDMMRLLYRDMGVTGSLGQPAIPIAVGRCVGGSTVVNGGTCWRTPDRVLERWAMEHGLGDAGPADMKPYFERV
ncbi:MAG: GMC family oxidoreductase, partial [Myxococcales bacterium]|nr:GMC family oxidoreductase [Myxococcales bacterium]